MDQLPSGPSLICPMTATSFERECPALVSCSNGQKEESPHLFPIMQSKLKGDHPLLTAACKGDLVSVTKFIAKNELKDCLVLTDETKKTPLHLAAREGHLELTQFFLDKG